MRISGDTFYCLKTTVEWAPLHEELALGISRKRLEADFFGNGAGFRLSVDGTPHKLTLSWKDLIDHAEKYMLFGTPFLSTRSFENIFRHKGDIEYTHQVFRQMAIEYRGDSRVSYALYAHYQKRVRQSWEIIAAQTMAAKDGVFDKQSWNAKLMKEFCSEFDFDALCRNGFISCLSQWIDYTEPIINASNFLKCLKRERLFILYSKQW